MKNKNFRRFKRCWNRARHTQLKERLGKINVEKIIRNYALARWSKAVVLIDRKFSWLIVAERSLRGENFHRKCCWDLGITGMTGVGVSCARLQDLNILYIMYPAGKTAGKSTELLSTWKSIWDWWKKRFWFHIWLSIQKKERKFHPIKSTHSIRTPSSLALGFKSLGRKAQWCQTSA